MNSPTLRPYLQGKYLEILSPRHHKCQQIWKQSYQPQKKRSVKMWKQRQPSLQKMFQLRARFPLTSGPFDSLAGPDIAIVTEVPGTSEVSTPTTQEPPAKRKCVSTRSEPGKPTKKSVQRKYSWKKENPKGGEFLFEKVCCRQAQTGTTYKRTYL